MIKWAFSSILVFAIFLISNSAVEAAGTVSGTIKSPHGQTAAVSYSFTSGGTTVTGTTAADGTFSQNLSDGDWSFTATPPSSFSYTDTLTIPTIRVSDGDSFDLGTIYFHFDVPEGADSDLEEIMELPPLCSQSGTPVIIRAYYEDEAQGSFLYQGDSANVIVVADDTTYTVEVDYSFIEGAYDNTPFSNPTYVETATHLGNGKYKATHSVAYAQEGGGMPIVKVTSGGVSSTYTCLTPGPVNLDIRNFFTGADTTDFTSVADFRAISNFTMHQDGVVKIVFRRAVNMLDPTVQKFMKGIAEKMVSSTGKVSLDARAVLDLKNAGAVITWYGLTNFTSTPTILLDGSDPGSAVSGVTYNRTAGTLTFDAAHFSEYAAVPSITISSPENNLKTRSWVTVNGTVNDPNATVRIKVGPTDQGTITVNGSGFFEKRVPLLAGNNTITVRASNSAGTSLPETRTVVFIPDSTTCNLPNPQSAPIMTNINRAGTQATLSFWTADGPVTHYQVAYGTKQDVLEYGGLFEMNPAKGITNVTINALSPSTTYYFKLNALNDCAPGEWSNILSSYPYYTDEGKVSYKEKEIAEPAEKKTRETQKEISPVVGEEVEDESFESSNPRDNESNKEKNFFQKIFDFFIGLFS